MEGLIIFIISVVLFEVLLAKYGVDTRDGKDWTFEQNSR